MKVNDVDQFLVEGCGRCKFFATPDCKVNTWKEELKLLRSLILEASALAEEIKWGMPCYTVNKKNVLMLAAFKEYCSISFFKGALITDPDNLMVSPGENSQAIKQFKFRSIDDIKKHKIAIQSFILQAIELEHISAKITFKKASEYAIPEEFQKCIDADSILKEAFYNLTPGRRRAYLLHFGQAKQAATRESRIEKCRAAILSGKGLNE